MAVVNTKSNIVTNADGDPRVKNPALIMGGRLREQVGTVEVAAADDDTSTFRMGRVHSSWRISSLELFNDAITAGTSYDLGLYDIAANGGAVVNATLFASAVDLSSARVAPLDIRYEAGDIINVEKAIWELLGLTADPGKFYDLVLRANTIGSAAGTISLRTRYTAND